MARPKIGIFGALFAVGGMLAWHWAKKHRAAQSTAARDLTRWEGEGGAISETPPATPSAPPPGGTHPRGANGADHAASGDAWPFPRS